MLVSHLYRPFIVALQFLTRIPTPQLDNIEDSDLGRSMIAYPFVGLLIGFILALMIFCLNGVLSVGLLAAIVMVSWLAITGALHIDGLADTADAWIGGYGDKARTLELMKDPTCGPMAVVAIVGVLLVKYAALVDVLHGESHALILLSLLLVPFIARTFLIVLFSTTPYVREGGLGDIIKRDLPRPAASWICGIALALVLLILGGKGITLILFLSLVFWLLRAAFVKRIGGTTGDTAGMLVEVIETVGLVILSVI